jgi:hypothetical protein
MGIRKVGLSVAPCVAMWQACCLFVHHYSVSPPWSILGFDNHAENLLASSMNPGPGARVNGDGKR